MSSTSLTLTLNTHIHWSKRRVWETSFGTLLKGKVEKTQPWNILTIMWPQMLCLRKSALALIPWQAVQGSFQQHWTFHCFLYSNLCPNSIKVHLLFLFDLGYRVKLMQERHSQCHESFFHLSSNVPLKRSRHRYSQVIQVMHNASGNTSEHCHKAYADLSLLHLPKTAYSRLDTCNQALGKYGTDCLLFKKTFTTWEHKHMKSIHS